MTDTNTTQTSTDLPQERTDSSYTEGYVVGAVIGFTTVLAAVAGVRYLLAKKAKKSEVAETPES